MKPRRTPQGEQSGRTWSSACRGSLIALCGLLACCSHPATVVPEATPEVFLQLGHSNSVHAIAFSPDGRLLASAGKDGAAKLWDVVAQREIRTLLRRGPLDSVAFSPDGERLATGGDDGAVVLWEVGTGRELRVLNAHSRPVRAIAFSADGRALASASDDHTIKLWDPGKGVPVRTLSAHRSGVTALAFSLDGHTLASGSVDRTIKLWDASTGKELRTLSGHSDRVTSVAFCSSGPILASGSWDRTVRIWDSGSGRELRELTGHTGEVSAVACARDGRVVAASGSSDHRINLWDIGSGRELPALVGEAKTVESLAFAPGGSVLASAGEADSVRLWDVVRGQPWRSLEGHAHFVKSVAFSADGRLLVSGSVDGVVRVWPIADAKERQRAIHAHDELITATVLTQDGGRVASRAADGTVKLWDPNRGTLLHSFEVGKPAGGSCSLALSPDGRLLAAGTVSHEIKLWSVAQGTELRSLAGHGGAVEAVAFSPDGRTLASASADKRIELWDVGSGRELGTLGGHTSWISCLAFSPDGKTLASGGGDKTIRLWDMAGGRERQSLPGHTAPVWAVAFSATGSILASSDADGVIKIWDARSGRELRTLRGHGDTVESVAFSPDGRLLASASGDSTVRLWDAASGAERLRLIAFNDGSSLRITPEGYFDSAVMSDQGGTAEAEAYLNVRVGNEVSGIGAYRERFYRPDLVRLALSDQKLPDALPTLASVKPAPDVSLVDVPAEVDTQTLDLHVSIADRGGGVGEVRALVNGTAVSDIPGRGLEVVEAAGAASRTIRVRLVPGNNEIQVLAFNTDGSVHSNPAAASVLARYSPARKPQLYALVVGIQDFTNTSLNLKYSVADANAIAQIVRQKAAPLFDAVHVETLTSQQTTSKQALAAAFARYQKIDPSDVFLFYVATHGTLAGDSLARREYYLIPSNFNTVSDAAIRRDALSEGEIKRLIASIPATRKLVLLDTCHAGAMGDAMMVTTRDLAESGAVTVLAGAVGSTILSASSSDQEALEGEDGHGLFTSVLLRGLSGDADLRKNGSVKTLDLAVFVDDEVPKIAVKHFKREQYPNTHNAGRSFEIVSTAR
jgi:WD40 repeat protein